MSQLRLLTLKQKFVLIRRLGLHDGRKYTQDEIAEAMGVTQGAVAQLEANARGRLLNLIKKPYNRTSM